MAMGCSMPRMSALACSVQTMRLAIGLRLAAHLLPVGHGEAKLREHLFMRDRGVVFSPFISFCDCPTFRRLLTAQPYYVYSQRRYSKVKRVPKNVCPPLNSLSQGGQKIIARIPDYRSLNLESSISLIPNTSGHPPVRPLDNAWYQDHE